MDSSVTSTSTTPDLPPGPEAAQTGEVVHGKVDQVLGKRQRVGDDETPPKDPKGSLSLADAIVEVREWIANGTKVVEARDAGDDSSQEENPVEKAKIDKSGEKAHKRNPVSCPYCSHG